MICRCSSRRLLYSSGWYLCFNLKTSLSQSGRTVGEVLTNPRLCARWRTRRSASFWNRFCIHCSVSPHLLVRCCRLDLAGSVWSWAPGVESHHRLCLWRRKVWGGEMMEKDLTCWIDRQEEHHRHHHRLGGHWAWSWDGNLRHRGSKPGHRVARNARLTGQDHPYGKDTVPRC